MIENEYKLFDVKGVSIGGAYKLETSKAGNKKASLRVEAAQRKYENIQKIQLFYLPNSQTKNDSAALNNEVLPWKL